MAKTVRIGCHSGFWGDTETAAVQLVRHGKVDYLVSDYLAEVTMSIMAAQKLRNPQAGYATDFVSAVMGPLAREIAEKKIKVVTNAGGVNPQACRDAVLKACEAAGVKLKVAVVLGDDILPRADEFRASGIREMDTGAELPQKIASMNAYFGGFPIARALDEGADVVITGRCVDSAVTLGALIHAFGWSMDDHDALAAGTLCGHIIECGAQCNGGNFTDWRLVPDYDNIGFPIAEVSGDGSFVLSKPEGTGGLITTATVAEQMLYKIGDPRAYIVPAQHEDRAELVAVGPGGGQGAAQRGIDRQEDAPHVRREEPGRLPRRQHRNHRRRSDLRAACAHRGQPRSRGQDRGQARPEGGAVAARP